MVKNNTGVRQDSYIKDPFYGVPTENHAFVDRQETLENMKAVLDDRFLWSNCSVVMLTGPKQVGKTQVMLNYTYHHRNAYRFAVWLKVDDKSVTADSFNRLAITLGFTPKESGLDNQAAAAQWVRTSFEKETNWLLLLDNADGEMAKKIFSLLPRNGGHIILTTQERETSITEAAVISVSRMKEEEAVSLLLGSASTETIEQDRIRYIREIVAKLDYMPLPIKLAHAYMISTGTLYQPYLSILKKKHSNFFPCCDEILCANYYEHILATVWYLSFENVRVTKPSTVRVLEICALICALPQPGSSSASEPESELSENIQPVRAVLTIFDFVAQPLEEPETDEDGSETGLLRTYLPVLEIINRLMDTEKKRQWVQRLATVFTEKVNLESADSLVESLENNTCDFSTEIFAELIISIPEIVFGANHPYTATVLSDLAELYSSQGNEVEAEVLYRRSLAINEALYEPNHPTVLSSFSKLAAVCVKRRKFGEAKSLYQKLLGLSEQTLGSNHLFRATNLSHLAELYGDQQKFDDAERLYEQALKIRENKSGLEHQSLAKILKDQGKLYQTQEKYDKAEESYQRALAIQEKALGEEHLDVAKSLTNLAYVYHSQKKYDLAWPHYERALAICEKKLGRDDPITGEFQSKLGDFYQSQEKYDEAEKYHLAALKIWNRAYGNENLYSVISLGKLVELYKAQDIEYKVTPRIREIKQINKILSETEDPTTIPGPDDPGTATFLNSLAETYDEQEKYDQAEQLFKRVLAIREKTLGLENIDTVKSLDTLVKFYLRRDKCNEAEPLCKQVLAIREKTLGSEHSDTMEAMVMLAFLYTKWNKYEEIDKLIRWKSSILEHSNPAPLLRFLGNFHALRKDFAKAQECALKAAGAIHPSISMEVDSEDPQSTLQQLLNNDESEPSVLFTIGVFCELGLGFPKDLSMAMELFAKAAKLNDQTASHYANL